MSDYTPTAWVNGGAPALSAANLNNMETGIDTAHQEIDAHAAAADPHSGYLLETLGAVRLAEVAPAGSEVVFTPPATYRHLMVVYGGRPAAGTSGDVPLGLQFEGDTTTNYEYHALQLDHTTLSQTGAILGTASSIAMGIVDRKPSLSDQNGFSGHVFIPHYRRTQFTQAMGVHMGRNSGSRITTNWWSGFRDINGPITTFRIFGFTFDSSIFTMYGVS